MISCSISFLPLGTELINEQVNHVLDIISQSGLQFEIGGMSTTLVGKVEEVSVLISEILNYADKETTFVLDVRYSNQCGLK